MKTLISTLLILILSGMFFSCNNSRKKHNGQSNEDSSVTATLPKPDHIIVVIEENHGYDQIIHSSMAPYINKLAQGGALFTNSHGITHPSQPNYIALFSGELQGVKGDECLAEADNTPYTTPNMGAALMAKGLTFGGYAQTLPADTFVDCYYGKSKLNGGSLYGRKHCPWVNWIGGGKNQLPVSVNHPMSEFPEDFDKLPTVAYVIPDMDHDMHNDPSDSTMITRADTWLKENVGPYIDWAKTHNSLFILTFDEDDFTPKNRIPTIFVGEMVKPGQYTGSINHYNVLRTIEDMYDLARSGEAAEGPITQVWK